MGKRENIYQLGGSVEMDEAFFGGKAAGKRGRGSENKAEAAVALQINAEGHLQYLKMQVIPDAKGETLLAFAEKTLLEAVQSIVMLSGLIIRSPQNTAVICRNMIPKVRMSV